MDDKMESMHVMTMHCLDSPQIIHMFQNMPCCQVVLPSRADQTHGPSMAAACKEGQADVPVGLSRSELQGYTKTKTDEIVNLNNTISRLKKQLETYEAESYAQETKKDYSLQVASQKTLEYGQVGKPKH